MPDIFIYFDLVQQSDYSMLEPWINKKDQGSRIFQSKTRETDFLFTRALLRRNLLNITGAENWTIKTATNGKPYLGTSKDEKVPHISLSHTTGLVACALCYEMSVGIDIEYNKPRAFQAIADLAFGIREREKVRSGSSSEFYEIWTQREAFAKMDGGGLPLVTSGCDLDPLDNCSFYHEIPFDNYHLSIAVRNPHGRNVKWIKA